MDRAKEAENKLNEKLPDLHEAMRRGERAKAILDDPLFKDAVRHVRDGAVREFTGSELWDDRTRTLARLKVDVLSGVVGELSRHMSDGKAAEKKLGQLRSALETAKKRILRRVA